MATIESIQTGRVRTLGDPDSEDPNQRQWTTAFGKTPLDGAAQITTERILGDQHANRTNHGGRDKVILCYPAAHYAQWLVEYPDLNWIPGAMGENFTIRGQEETNVCIGDVYSIGRDCLVQVSQPRGPCWKISRFHQTKTLLKSVIRTGRTGWYLRVLRGGAVCFDDELILQEFYHPEWPISRANDVAFGREKDPRLKAELLGLQILSEQWKESL